MSLWIDNVLDTPTYNVKYGPVIPNGIDYVNRQGGIINVPAIGDNTTASSENIPDCGFINDTNSVPLEYVVTISSSTCGTVRAILQEDIMLKVDANWQPIVNTTGSAGLAAIVNVVSGGRSLVTEFGSRRVWMGTSPITFSINLVFQAVNNPLNEVIEPIKRLQKMALPTRLANNGTASDLLNSFLQAPGPNPLSGGDPKRGDIINIHIGTMLTLNTVIVRAVEAKIISKLGPNGPISGICNLIFETYEIITKESYEGVWSTRGNIPPSSHEGQDVINAMGNAVKDVWTKAKNWWIPD